MDPGRSLPRDLTRGRDDGEDIPNHSSTFSLYVFVDLFICRLMYPPPHRSCCNETIQYQSYKERFNRKYQAFFMIDKREELPDEEEMHYKKYE